MCTIGYVQIDIDTFAFSVSQVVQDASLRAHINVCARLAHPAWLPLPLLSPNAVVTISGTVLAFQNGWFLVLVRNIDSFPPRRAPTIHSNSGITSAGRWDEID